ncbi:MULTISPECIES: flagellar export protein FliJ [Shewanella]|jgi:flagellar FliJ protein|uniref:Flagellar FliJ protein n=1 Tax=Shewanella fodinae TaxID=552357 RepID=A0A4R2FCN9_9GAMM|nr:MULTISPECIES: flagellar export protein FliJ [Shewanella]MBO1273047.1 flagellar export protein FliJ [Shewanella sp. 4t3-1-2LB]MDN5370176.1 flagellar protein FliJ [Shewanella sp.]TCN85797.1 flagellar FliJ protein [Shewanella fodinae]
MAQTDPLLTVLKLANEAEEQAALRLKAAQFEHQKRVNQLQSLRDYRLDYMRQLAAQQGQQIRADYYQQFHRFVRQVDEAIKQQLAVVAEAERQKQYRQQHWMEKQQKRKAVELLLEKKALQKQQRENKQEQKLIDEFASQQFQRRKLSTHL